MNRWKQKIATLMSAILIVSMCAMPVQATELTATEQPTQSTTSASTEKEAPIDAIVSLIKSALGLGEDEEDLADGEVVDDASGSDAILDDGEITDSEATPSDAVLEIVPLSNSGSISVTKAEIREGSTSGTVVTDLLANKTPTLDADKLYYLCVSATKTVTTDNDWVAIDLPYWMVPVNMVGGDDWKVVGTTLSASGLDKIVGYAESTGYSTVYNTTAGKVTYRLRKDSQVATFAIGFKPASEYFDGNESGQDYTASTKQLGISVGDMSDDNETVIDTVVDSVYTTKVTLAGTANVVPGTEHFPTIGFDSVQQSSRDTSFGKTIWTALEFDAEYPSAATVTEVMYGGVVATAGASSTSGGKTTTHYTVSVPAGTNAGGISAKASFPSSVGEVTQTMDIKNMSFTAWGDDTSYHETGSTLLSWMLSTAPPQPSLGATDFTRFDWLEYEGLKESSLVATVQMKTNGANTATTAPQTINATYDKDNLDVRFAAVPLGEGCGTTIEINGSTYNLDDVITAKQAVNTTATNPIYLGYALVSAKKAGVTELETISYNMGYLYGSSDSGSISSGDAPHIVRIAAYGNFSQNQTGVSTFNITNTTTGTITVADTTSTVHPTDEKKVRYIIEPSGPGWNFTQVKNNNPAPATVTSIMAGETLHAWTTWGGVYWVDMSGATTGDDYQPCFYLAVPKGFTFSNIAIDNQAIAADDIVDVTDQVTGLPEGTTVLQIQTADGTHHGCWPEEMDGGSGSIEFDITTSKTLAPCTMDMSKMVLIGTDTAANIKMQYIAGNYGLVAPNADVFGPTNITEVFNGGKSMGAFKGQIQVQDGNTVSVTNTMTITKNGTPLNSSLQYDEDDPINTSAEVDTGFEGKYNVNVTNNTGANATDAVIFVPIPKEGQDFGAAFSPEGPQEFDVKMSIPAASIPAGWTVQYVKMKPGKTYPLGRFPAAADYDEVADPDDADMIVITGPTSLADQAGAEFEFDVSGDGELTPGTENTWGVISKYEVSGTIIVPSTMYPEKLRVPDYGYTATFVSSDITKGTVSGTVVQTEIPYNGNADSSLVVIQEIPPYKFVNWTYVMTVDSRREDRSIGAHGISALADGEIVGTTMDPNSITMKGDVTFTAHWTDIPVEKTVDKDNLYTDQLANYTITVTNNGTYDISNYFLVDKLPDGLTYVSSDPVATYSDADKTLTWVYDFAVGASKTVTVQVRATAEGVFTNHAYVYAPSTASDAEPDTSKVISEDESTVTVKKTETPTPPTPTPGGGSSGGGGGSSVTPTNKVSQPSLTSTSQHVDPLYGLNPDGTPRGTVGMTGMPKTGEEAFGYMLWLLIICMGAIGAALIWKKMSHVKK